MRNALFHTVVFALTGLFRCEGFTRVLRNNVHTLWFNLPSKLILSWMTNCHGIPASHMCRAVAHPSSPIPQTLRVFNSILILISASTPTRTETAS